MKSLLSAVVAVALAGSAFGGVVWTFDTNNLAPYTTVNADAGLVSNLHTEFDTNTDKFVWNVTFSDGVAKNSNGYWLVVSTGANPNGTAFQHAIIYFDAINLAAPKVSIYRYNGGNDATSYQNPADLLASSQVVSPTNIVASASQAAGARTFNLSLDATVINNLFGPPTNPNWEGIEFGQQLGIWFHPTAGTVTTYNGSQLTFFGATQAAGWYDGALIQTVPSAGSTALLALGGLIAARRRRA